MTMSSQIQTAKEQIIDALRSQNFNFQKVRFLLNYVGNEPMYNDSQIAAYLAICLMEDSTAGKVGDKLGISRAGATDYLNQLVTKGNLKKYTGRDRYVFFTRHIQHLQKAQMDHSTEIA